MEGFAGQVDLRMDRTEVVHSDATKNQADNLDEWRWGQTGQQGLLYRIATLLLYPGSHKTRNRGMWATGTDLPVSKSD